MTAAEGRRASKSTLASFVRSRIVTAYLRRCHANLLCIVSIDHDPLEVDGKLRKSRNLAATIEGTRGDHEEVAMTSGTYLEGEMAICRSLEESFLIFLLFSSRRAGRSAA